MSPERARRQGCVPAFPIPGRNSRVRTMNFLRTALNAQAQGARRRGRIIRRRIFWKKVREVAKSLNIPRGHAQARASIVGFSGGEKKRNEVLQMALFRAEPCDPREMDSGLDIDALRIAADGVNALRSPERAMVVITHYQRLLNYIVPDVVHVMSKGAGSEERRQRTGAGAGSLRLCPVRGRGLSWIEQ